MKGLWWLLPPLMVALLAAAWWGWQQTGLQLLPLGLGVC